MYSNVWQMTGTRTREVNVFSAVFCGGQVKGEVVNVVSDCWRKLRILHTHTHLATEH